MILERESPQAISTFARPAFTHSRSAKQEQLGGSSASSTIMLGMSSLIANRTPHWVQIKTSPSCLSGTLPMGQTNKARNWSLTMARHPSGIRPRNVVAGLAVQSETKRRSIIRRMTSRGKPDSRMASPGRPVNASRILWLKHEERLYWGTSWMGKRLDGWALLITLRDRTARLPLLQSQIVSHENLRRPLRTNASHWRI
jgi:hypothetical protein